MTSQGLKTCSKGRANMIKHSILWHDKRYSLASQWQHRQNLILPFQKFSLLLKGNERRKFYFYVWRKFYCADNYQNTNISNQLNILVKTLGRQIKIYENMLIVDNFNSEITVSKMENFRQTHHPHNFIKNLMF